MRVKKLKLSALSEVNMQDKEMNALKGGENCCYCSCYWEGRGGSSSGDNTNANYKGNLISQHGCNQYANCDYPAVFPEEPGELHG